MGHSDKKCAAKNYPIAIFSFLYKPKEGQSISSSRIVLHPNSSKVGASRAQ